MRNGSYQILEVGCGSGKNIGMLANAFPKAIITGLDASRRALEKANKRNLLVGNRVDLYPVHYNQDTNLDNQFDLILFSYFLSGIQTDWKSIIEKAKKDLKPGGLIGIIDFHYSNYDQFNTFMKLRNVDVTRNILPYVSSRFDEEYCRVKSSCVGFWQFFIFIGSTVPSL